MKNEIKEFLAHTRVNINTYKDDAAARTFIVTQLIAYGLEALDNPELEDLFPEIIETGEKLKEIRCSTQK